MAGPLPSAAATRSETELTWRARERHNMMAQVAKMKLPMSSMGGIR